MVICSKCIPTTFPVSCPNCIDGVQQKFYNFKKTHPKFQEGFSGFQLFCGVQLLHIVWEISCAQNVAKLMSFKFDCSQSSSSFGDTITSNTFLVTASYANLHNRILLLYILTTPLWMSASRNPAAENRLLRMCMNIINIPIINTQLLNFCFSFYFISIALE